jgi:hypothetical protein
VPTPAAPRSPKQGTVIAGSTTTIEVTCDGGARL